MSEFLVVTSTIGPASPGSPCLWCWGCSSASAPSSCACRAWPSAPPRRRRTRRVGAQPGAALGPSRPGAGRRACICRGRWSPGSRPSRGCWAEAMTQDLTAFLATARPRAKRRIGPGRATSLDRSGVAGAARPAGGAPTGRCSGSGASTASRASGAAGRGSEVAVASASPCPEGGYPAVSIHRPSAIRLERAIRDLFGLEAEGAADAAALARPRPLAAPLAAPSAKASPMTFLAAEATGASLHQIPVGPVHAGIIEPGHFRFHANGETVVRLEARLGYTHKGIEALMVGRKPRRGGAARGAALRRQHRRPFPRLRPRGGGGPRDRGAGARRTGCAR